jgi:predicted nucleic acid-binding protein
VAEPVVLDTGPPSTFARVGRLDLLRERLAGRAILPGEVVAELERGVRAYSALQDVLDADWLEIRPPFDTPDDLVAVERLRMAIVGSAHDPRKNLGEAAAIILAKKLDAHIAIDDYDGANLARARGLMVLDSIKLLQESIAMGELSCAEAIKAYEKMRQVSLLPELTRRQLCS